MQFRKGLKLAVKKKRKKKGSTMILKYLPVLSSLFAAGYKSNDCYQKSADYE